MNEHAQHSSSSYLQAMLAFLVSDPQSQEASWALADAIQAAKTPQELSMAEQAKMGFSGLARRVNTMLHTH